MDDGRHFRLDNLLFVDFSAHTEAALLFLTCFLSSLLNLRVLWDAAKGHLLVRCEK